MARSRGSRFTGLGFVLGNPQADDKRTPGQRGLEREVEAQGREAFNRLLDELGYVEGGDDGWRRVAHTKMRELHALAALAKQLRVSQEEIRLALGRDDERKDDEYFGLVGREIDFHQEASEAAGAAGREEWHTDAVATVEQEAGGWTVRWLLARHDGAYVVRSVRVEPLSPSTPAGGITTNLLRELSPSSAVAMAGEARDSARRPLEPFEEVGFGIAFLEEYVKRMGPVHAKKPTRGRPRTTDRRLAEVALAYMKDLEDRNGKGITQRIADHFTIQDGHRVDPSTVTDWVRRARTDGWLTRADRQMGRRGAEYGPRFLELTESEKGDLK